MKRVHIYMTVEVINDNAIAVQARSDADIPVSVAESFAATALYRDLLKEALGRSDQPPSWSEPE